MPISELLRGGLWLHRRESEEFYIRHQDAHRDYAALHDETQAYRHEWQCQDTDDHATRSIIRIQAQEARARVDTLEDTGSSA
ncbi:hypothetical protein Tco_1235805 [Tanacetum coccineum]